MDDSLREGCVATPRMIGMNSFAMDEWDESPAERMIRMNSFAMDEWDESPAERMIRMIAFGGMIRLVEKIRQRMDG